MGTLPHSVLRSYGGNRSAFAYLTKRLAAAIAPASRPRSRLQRPQTRSRARVRRRSRRSSRARGRSGPAPSAPSVPLIAVNSPITTVKLAGIELAMDDQRRHALIRLPTGRSRARRPPAPGEHRQSGEIVAERHGPGWAAMPPPPTAGRADRRPRRAKAVRRSPSPSSRRPRNAGTHRTDPSAPSIAPMHDEADLGHDAKRKWRLRSSRIPVAASPARVMPPAAPQDRA